MVTSRAECTEKGGPPEASRPRRRVVVAARLLLAGELPALHVAPDLLRHVGRPDRRAPEDGLHRVLAALEADRVPAERLLLRHRLSLLLVVVGHSPLTEIGRASCRERG